jgi:hypothetical protein
VPRLRRKPQVRYRRRLRRLHCSVDKDIRIWTSWMETTDHVPPSSVSLCGSTYAYARSEESDIRPFFETPTDEKRLVRKLDRRILPIMCLLYFFACGSHLTRCGCILIAITWIQTWTGRALAMRVCKVCQRMFSEAIRQESYSTGLTPHFSFHL